MRQPAHPGPLAGGPHLPAPDSPPSRGAPRDVGTSPWVSIPVLTHVPGVPRGTLLGGSGTPGTQAPVRGRPGPGAPRTRYPDRVRTIPTDVVKPWPHTAFRLPR